METYSYTRVVPLEPDRVAELRACVAAALAGPLRWRHHAIGALQAYFAEDTEPEVRVHIWHPDLVRTDPASDGGRVHDHRFGLVSAVLAGSVGHEEVDVDPDPEGAWAEYTVQHARAGSAPLRPTGRRLAATTRRGSIRAGETYSFPMGLFHRSFVPEPAVTLVTKRGQRATPARVLFPVGYAPTFGVAAIDDSAVVPYVAQAIASLRAAMTPAAREGRR